MSDKYESFEELKDDTEGDDRWAVRTDDRDSDVLVMAIHGGNIEKGTSEIAELIAETGDYSYYAFEGDGDELRLKPDKFDESEAVDMASESDYTVSVIELSDAEDDKVVHVGGRQTALRNAVWHELDGKDFVCDTELEKTYSDNIVNRNNNGGGVQLELSTKLIDSFFEDDDRSNRDDEDKWTDDMQSFADAVVSAIDDYKKEIRMDSYTSYAMNFSGNLDFGRGSNQSLKEYTDDEFEKADEKIDDAKKDIEEAGKRLDENENKISDAESDIKDAEKDIDVANDKLDDHSKKLDDHDDKLSKADNRIDDAEDKLSDHDDKLEDTKKDLKNTSDDLSDTKEDLKKAKDDLEDNDDKVKEAAEKYADKTAKDTTEKYAEKKIHKGDDKPDDPEDGDLWWDTSSDPSVLRKYNEDDDEWENQGPSKPEDIGAIDKDEYKDKIDEIEKDLDDKKDQLDDKLDKDKYDEKVDDLEKDIADRAEVDYVDGHLEDKANKNDTYEKKEVDDKIDSRVKKEEYETDQDGIIKRLDNAESSIEQNEDSIESKVEKDEFDALQVGGRNLVEGTSDDYKKLKPGKYKKHINEVSGRKSLEDLGLDEGDNVTFQLFIDAEDEDYGGRARFTFYKEKDSDKKKKTETGDVIEGGDKGYSKVTHKLDEDNKYVTLDVQNEDGGHDHGQELKYKKAKAEKGSKATDWTPAPEDVDKEIDDLGDKISSAESDIKQQADEIESRVKTKDYDELKGRVKDAESSIDQHSDEIESRVKKEDHDDLKDRVKDTESSIDQHDDEIESRVKKDDYKKDQDDLKDRVDSAESSIDQHADEIESKVSEDKYKKDIEDDDDGLKAKVKSAESDIKQQADSIESRVKKDDYKSDQEDVADRLDSAESDIKQHSDEIESRVKESTYEKGIDEAKKHADDIEVGGRNLLTKANIEDADNEDTSGFKTLSDDYKHGFKVTGKEDKKGYVSFDNVIPENGTYTVSFRIRGTQGSVISVKVNIAGHISEEKISSNKDDEYGEIKHFTADVDDLESDSDSDSFNNYIRFQSFEWVHYLFDDIKLEKGSKATDWTPAPEDYDERFSDAESDIKQNADEIESRVKETDFDDAKDRISKAESSIDQHADSIESRVKKDGVVSSLNQTPESVKVDAKRIDLEGAVTADSIKSLKGLNVNDELIIDDDGNVTMAGKLDAASGSFSGTLKSVDGEFTGKLKAVDGDFTGTLKSAKGKFAGELEAVSGSFSGDLDAKDATFTKGTFKQITAKDATVDDAEFNNATIKDATVSGDFDAKDATFTEGTFKKIVTEDAILNDAGIVKAKIKDSTITGDLDAKDAVIKKGTFQEVTIEKNAKIKDATIAGDLTADDAVFKKGTFKQAKIEDASITGELNGVTGDFSGTITSHSSYDEVDHDDFDESDNGIGGENQKGAKYEVKVEKGHLEGRIYGDGDDVFETSWALKGNGLFLKNETDESYMSYGAGTIEWGELENNKKKAESSSYISTPDKGENLNVVSDDKLKMDADHIQLKAGTDVEVSAGTKVKLNNKMGTYSTLFAWGGEKREQLRIYSGGDKVDHGATIALYGNNDEKLPGAFRLYDGSKESELFRGYKGNLFTYTAIKAKSEYLMESTKKNGLIHMPTDGSITFARSNGTVVMAIKAAMGEDDRRVIQLPGTEYYTTGGDANMHLSKGKYHVARVKSSRDVKKNIEDVDMDAAEHFIEHASPITFESMAPADEGDENYGFIAEDMDEVDQKLTIYDEKDKPESVAYARVPVLHHVIIKDNRERIKELEEENKKKDEKIDELEKRLEKLEAKLDAD